MSFLQYLNIGIEKASQSDLALKEVNDIFENLNNDLKNYEAGTLKIIRYEDTSLGALLTKMNKSGEAKNPEYFKHDSIGITLSSRHETRKSKVAGWSQSMKGYPCIIKFNNQELVCNTSDQLINGLQLLLSSIEFGSTLYKLSKELKEIDTKMGSSTNEKSPAKTATAEAATKTTAAREPAKTATGKAAAKTITGKAAAKTITGKAATKTTTGKAATKTTTGKAATKTTTGKAATKTTTGKAAAKTATTKA